MAVASARMPACAATPNVPQSRDSGRVTRAISARHARSRSLATIVVVTASAVDAPRRTARRGRENSPALIGRRWFSSRLAWRLPNRLATAIGVVSRSRHAIARSQNAVVYASEDREHADGGLDCEPGGIADLVPRRRLEQEHQRERG